MNEAQDRPTRENRAGDIFLPVIADPATIPAPVGRSEARRSERFVRSQIDLWDRNNDGYLSAAEIRRSVPLEAISANLLNPVVAELNAHNQRAGAISALRRQGAVTENPVLFDVGTITQLYANNPQTPGLTPASIAEIVRDVLPRGAATITLSDECNHSSPNVCIALPNQQLYLTSRGPTI